jgi:glycosyltransferase involved in cell wall biosynthesis
MACATCSFVAAFRYAISRWFRVELISIGSAACVTPPTCELNLDSILGCRVLVNVAALAPHKAQSDLLEALKQLRATYRFRCFIVGEGELRSELEARARLLHIDDVVTFTGFRDDALEFIRLANVFVMSSRLEGLGTSIMDAQVLGAPVVATRTGGIPELVEDGVTGLLAEPGDRGSLARCARADVG